VRLLLMAAASVMVMADWTGHPQAIVLNLLALLRKGLVLDRFQPMASKPALSRALLGSWAQGACSRAVATCL